ncbi:MAG: hypothetical protein ACI4DY_10525 [Monoglobaceae bacterium]
MKKLFKKAISAAVAVMMMACNIPYPAVHAADTGTLQKVPYTLIRSIGSSNDIGQKAVYNDGQFTDDSLVPYWNNKGTWTKTWGGRNTFTATNASLGETGMGVTLKFASSDTEITNIILYGGAGSDNLCIKEPEKSLKVRYSTSTDKITDQLKTSAAVLEADTWTLLGNDDYTLTNVMNNGINIQYGDVEVYKLNGANTKTDSTGSTDLTYTVKERTQQVLAVNLKKPIKAGTLFITYEPEDTSLQMSLTEIEIYNNTSGNLLFGQGVSEVYPQIKPRDPNYDTTYSVFGTLQDDGRGSFVQTAGIALTDGRKITGRKADRWFTSDTTAHGVPYVEYTLDGSTTIDQIDIYSGLLDEEGTYMDLNGDPTVYGAVDFQGVALAYKNNDSDEWKTVKTNKPEVRFDEESNGNILTLSFGDITPSKIRLYVGVGTYASDSLPSVIAVKEIEAYNTADTDAAVDTVDILRADEGITGNLDNRTSDTYIAKNSGTFNWNQETDITLSFSSPVEDGAEISISDNDDTKPDPTVGATTLAADKCSAYTVVSGLQPNTTYSVSVTGASDSYNFATAGDYAINSFGFSDTATVAYDVTRIAADASDLMAIVGVYDGNMLISSSSEMLAFTADSTNASGSLTATVPEGVSNPKVKAFLWDQKSLKPIKYVRNNTYANQTLHIIGDSIYADYDVYTQYAPDYGIGQALSKILGVYGVKINNEAIPGCSTSEWGTIKSKVLPDIKQGDHALISLCHNDQKKLTVEQYKANLVTIANDVKEQGGTPIFITAVPRYLWDSNGLKTTISVEDTTVDAMDYINTMLAVGEENDIPVIDLNAHLRELYTAMGTTSESYKYFYSTNTNEKGEVYFDSTHLSETGATYCANWLIDRFEIMGLPFV